MLGLVVDVDVKIGRIVAILVGIARNEDLPILPSVLNQDEIEASILYRLDGVILELLALIEHFKHREVRPVALAAVLLMAERDG